MLMPSLLLLLSCYLLMPTIRLCEQMTVEVASVKSHFPLLSPTIDPIESHSPWTNLRCQLTSAYASRQRCRPTSTAAAIAPIAEMNRFLEAISCLQDKNCRFIALQCNNRETASSVCLRELLDKQFLSLICQANEHIIDFLSALSRCLAITLSPAFLPSKWDKRQKAHN